MSVTVAGSTLRSADSSRVDFLGLSSTSDFKRSLSTSEGRPLCSSSSRDSSPSRNLLNQNGTVLSDTVVYTKARFMLRAVSVAFFPNFNSYKQIVRICRFPMMTLGWLEMAKHKLLNKSYTELNKGQNSLCDDIKHVSLIGWNCHCYLL